MSARCLSLLSRLGLFAEASAALSAGPTVDAQNNKRQTQQLTLVNPDVRDHRALPRLLHFFEKLNEKAEREDAREHPAKEPARRNLIFVLAIQ